MSVSSRQFLFFFFAWENLQKKKKKRKKAEKVGRPEPPQPPRVRRPWLERVRVCWLHARTVADQSLSRVYFPRVLCRVQHHRFEQGPSRGYFLVCSSLWTAYADRDHGLCDGGEEYKWHWTGVAISGEAWSVEGFVDEILENVFFFFFFFFFFFWERVAGFHRAWLETRLFTSQITGSPPLLSEWDILCEMEHEGRSIPDSERVLRRSTAFYYWKVFIHSNTSLVS